MGHDRPSDERNDRRLDGDLRPHQPPRPRHDDRLPRPGERHPAFRRRRAHGRRHRLAGQDDRVHRRPGLDRRPDRNEVTRRSRPRRTPTAPTTTRTSSGASPPRPTARRRRRSPTRARRRRPAAGRVDHRAGRLAHLRLHAAEPAEEDRQRRRLRLRLRHGRQPHRHAGGGPGRLQPRQAARDGDAGSGVTALGYDDRGNRTSAAPAVGVRANYAFDQADRLTIVDAAAHCR